MTAPAIVVDLEAMLADGDDEQLMHWACFFCNVIGKGIPVLLCGKESHWECYDPSAAGPPCIPCRDAEVCPKCGRA